MCQYGCSAKVQAPGAPLLLFERRSQLWAGGTFRDWEFASVHECGTVPRHLPPRTPRTPRTTEGRLTPGRRKWKHSLAVASLAFLALLAVKAVRPWTATFRDWELPPNGEAPREIAEAAVWPKVVRSRTRMASAPRLMPTGTTVARARPVMGSANAPSSLHTEAILSPVGSPLLGVRQEALMREPLSPMLLCEVARYVARAINPTAPPPDGGHSSRVADETRPRTHVCAPCALNIEVPC